MSRVLATGAVVVSMAILYSCGGPSAATAPSPSVAPPSPRWGSSLAYDEANRDLVLFGGSSPSGSLNETWTWDGKDWRRYEVRPAPPRGMTSLLAYDPTHRDVLLFGSLRQADSWVNGTWTWNGSSWQELRPQHEPAVTPDWEPTMASDPVSGTVLLLGFIQVRSGSTATMQPQTWSWNGKDWMELSPALSPQAPGQLISGGSRLYMTGASPVAAPGSDAGGMWQWDGSQWTFTATPSYPSGPAAFDQGNATIVLFNRDTWTWAGSKWVRQHPTDHPEAMGYMAYFPPLRKVVMWGDVTGRASNAMWAWDGTNWSLLQAGSIAPSPTPGHRDSATPAEAAALIRQIVTSTTPVLLPTWLPAGLDATVDATPDYFTVTYQTDQRDKQITFGIVVANPPPATGPHAAGGRLKFRSALAPKFGQPGYADHMVYDTTDPGSQRWLMWTEPGTMSPSAQAEGFGGPGVPYYLSAIGYTDQEFWQVANSLQ